MTDAWRAGVHLLEERLAALPDVLRRVSAEGIAPLPIEPAEVRRVVTTGIGSSAAHARFLAHVLAEEVGLDARYLPTSALMVPPASATGAVLVVFSQGLSPNGRLPLAAPERWRQVVLVTAVRREAELAPLRARGVHVAGMAGEDEFGTLVRVTGPMAGYLTAVQLARAFSATPGAVLPAFEPERIAAAVERAPALVADVDPACFAEGVAFVTSGSYGMLVSNLQYKVLEGMLLPLPPVWDVLDVAHGPLQQMFGSRGTLVALGRADAPGEAELLTRLERVLVPGTHRLLRLVATLPGPLAIFAHEAQLNALLVRFLRTREIDQVEWPGRGGELPLYAVEHVPAATRLGELTWQEVEAAVAAGRRTAVLALGSTEQHGPHLPCAADTWIAEALVERVAARLDAFALPVVPVGCAVEHMDFAGTLDLRATTLAALLEDILTSLGRHGIERAFVFSAHGGNGEPLRRALPALRAAVPLELIAFTDLDVVASALHDTSAREGIAAEAAGHHAGEVETSILLALHPHAVRQARMAPGHAAPAAAQSIFYPSLRPNAPTGVVGDPRAADAVRGARYLAVWVDVLVAAYQDEKKSA